MTKLDDRLVNVLNAEDRTEALVRVRNPLQLAAIERNFEITRSYPFIRAVGVMCGLSEAIKLEKMPEVEYVAAQSLVSACAENFSVRNNAPDKTAFVDYNAAANEAFFDETDGGLFSSSELTGEGVTLCVMDTGISVHTDLSVPRERIVHFIDLVGGTDGPYDDNGHGTFVSGVAAGNGILSGGKVRGVAPKANLIGLKVISETGETGTFKILDGMQWLFDNAVRYGIKVVCMSFGAEPMQYADPLKLGVEMLVASGLTVVCAAGNSGPNGLKSPGISPDVISVGAVDVDGTIAGFSSYGVYQGYARPDVYAKGVKLKGIKAGGAYSIMSGTSVSAPYVAGACCLLHQRFKNLKPWQAKKMIIDASYRKNGVRIFSLD